MTTPTGSVNPVKLTQEEAGQDFNNLGRTVAPDNYLLNLELYFRSLMEQFIVKIKYDFKMRR